MTGNYYIILGVDMNASIKEIKAAYRQRVMEFHPDHFGENHAPFLAVQEAYSTLRDPVKRRAYDRTLQSKKRVRRIDHVEPLVPKNDYRQDALARSIDSFFPRINASGQIVHEYPVSISLPPGILHTYVARIPLDQFGVRDFTLLVKFKVDDYEER